MKNSSQTTESSAPAQAICVQMADDPSKREQEDNVPATGETERQ